MKDIKIFIVIILLSACHMTTDAHQIGSDFWEAHWISADKSPSKANTWLAYRKSFDLGSKPDERIIAKIAVDSKYWLWINDRLVVFEGGLKRGPNPRDTYYDEVDITSSLKKGRNNISVLVCYFGKQGYSHNSSGTAGMLFDCQSESLKLLSDASWKCTVLNAYQSAGEPFPNLRLPESSILYDARVNIGEWYKSNYNDSQMAQAVVLAAAGDAPWNSLVQRPIPLFKEYGLKKYMNQTVIPAADHDTIVCSLPYNAQITTYFDITANEGDKIKVMTDNFLFYNGGDGGIRSEYIAKQGAQKFESLGWVNGHKVYYIFPKGTKVHYLMYRESGYDTEFEGTFQCSSDFFNRLWQKSLRTLYITMRDSYMDCPDRERAQWTGDAVNESGESFYVLSTSSHALIKKWLYEVVNGWQRQDGSIYAPVPSNNYDSELPGQTLATVGYYGLWTYYLNTGDKQILVDLYDNVKRYLELWEVDQSGLVKMRNGGWTWGDWGDNKDMLLLYNLWYQLAVKGMYNIAMEINKPEDARKYAAFIDRFKKSFNEQFWTGSSYRDPAYKGETDDRAQALAIVAGVADKDKYPALLKVFGEEFHASAYMEKYVFEAMMQMCYADAALSRHQKRYEYMVGHDYFTTLFEGWGFGPMGFGGGTVNHAWSGGGLTILSQYVCGIAPTKPGWSEFHILPQPGSIGNAEILIPTVKGNIKSSFSRKGTGFIQTAVVPDNTTAIVGVPQENVKKVSVNGKVVWENGSFVNNTKFKPFPEITSHIAVVVGPGKYVIKATASK